MDSLQGVKDGHSEQSILLYAFLPFLFRTTLTVGACLKDLRSQARQPQLGKIEKTQFFLFKTLVLLILVRKNEKDYYFPSLKDVPYSCLYAYPPHPYI